LLVPHDMCYTERMKNENYWLDQPGFAEFKAGYEYAKSKTRWYMAGLQDLTPEQAYWVWSIITHGIEYEKRQNRTC